VTVTFADDASGDGCTSTIVRVWTATDECGNTSTCTQVITVVDDEAPVVIDTPSDITVGCDEEIPVAPVLTADDCQGVIVGELSEEVIDGDCVNNFTIVRTWTFDDGCGNVSSVSSSVNVVDDEAPQFDLGCAFDFVLPTSGGADCPAEASFSFEEGDEFPITQGYTIAGFEIPSLFGCVVDNCTAEEDIIIKVANISEVGDDCVKTFTVDFEAIDECGNVGGGFSCNYEVIDDTAPELIMPDELEGEIPASEVDLDVVESFVNGELSEADSLAFIAFAEQLFVSNGLIPLGTTDNCNPSDWVEVAIDVVLGDCTEPAQFNCFFIAVDDCGNESEPVVTTITVVEDTPPVIECPDDATVSCDEDTSPANTGMATATDNCGGEVTLTFVDGEVSGDGCLSSFTRTWTATDESGNTASCDQVITIVDDVAPELIMPAQTSVDITCMAVDYAMLLDYVAGNLTPTQESVYLSFLAGIFIQNNLVPVDAVDACNDASFEEIGIEIITEVDCPSKAIVQCIFVAEDECGNVSDPEFTQLVVVDNTTPHIFCPADAVVTCGEDFSPDETGFATATDNCVGDVDITWTDLNDPADFCPTSIIRLWTATDECGNIATCEQLITFVEEGDCVTPPTGLEAEALGPNTIQFTWDPVPNSVACRVIGRPQGTNTNFTLGTIIAPEPSVLTKNIPQLYNGLNIEWRVICACELSPLLTTPFSPWTHFEFFYDDNKSFTPGDLVESDELNGTLYPNPTRTNVFLESEFNEGESITVMDLSGKVVAQYNVTVGSGLFEINLEELESGVYFIQHAGLDGRSQTFKVLKNN
jgi:hypothetical protein